jgi:hypothetical protein
MHDRVDTAEAFDCLPEVRQIREQKARLRLGRGEYVHRKNFTTVVCELADNGTAGFPARSGDDDLHADEA